MSQRQITTPGGVVTVTPEGAHIQVTHMYTLSGAPLVRVRGLTRPTWFRPDAAEVCIDGDDPVHLTLIGDRVTAAGNPPKKSLQRAATVYQPYSTPWDDLPEWAEPLVTMHHSLAQDPS